MPLPQLPGTVACALLPIDADEGAASWIPVVRAAVRRTQQRLFLLFTGVKPLLSTPADHISRNVYHNADLPVHLQTECTRVERFFYIERIPEVRRCPGFEGSMRGPHAAGIRRIGGRRCRGQAPALCGAPLSHRWMGGPGCWWVLKEACRCWYTYHADRASLPPTGLCGLLALRAHSCIAAHTVRRSRLVI